MTNIRIKQFISNSLHINANSFNIPRTNFLNYKTAINNSNLVISHLILFQSYKVTLQ